MQESEIKKLFSEAISKRNWYANTSISNRYQANGIKSRFNTGELSLGKILEILFELGYKVEVKAP